MSISLLHYLKSTVFFCFLFVGIVIFSLPIYADASDTGVTTVDFDLMKKFSGPVPDGYTADQFSFQIDGTIASGSIPFSESISLTAVDDNTATGVAVLQAGIYTIEETGPTGFVQEEWTVQWSGAGCDSLTAPSTSIVVDQSDLGKLNYGCRADNQWRYGNLRVVKDFVGTSTAYENFEFTVTQGSDVKFNGPFEADGDNEIVLAEGTYSVEETPYNGYTPSYSADCSGTITNSENKTCTITNTYDSIPNYDVYGCIDSTANNYDPYATIDDGSCVYEELYLIDGYVWHDENEDGIIDEGEDYLEGWELQLVSGSTTFTTSSDSGGYFSFSVVAGTWTLSEVLEDDWTQVFPTPTSYTIVVPDDIIISSNVTFGFPLNLFFSVAQAQTVTTGGPFNFGNLFTGGGGSNNTFTCSISASDSEVKEGSTVTLNWNATGAVTTSIDNGIGSTTPVGSLDVVVNSNTTYILTATNNSSTSTCSTSISISPSGGGGHGGRRSGGSISSGGGTNTATVPDVKPVPKVLGEQVSIIPAGAPDTGAGGTSKNSTTGALFLLIFLSLSAILLTRKTA